MIIRAVGQQRMTVDALIALTGASPITIRRDLADLEGRGLLKRVHGGAVRVDNRGQPMPYSLRSHENLEQKLSLATVAASLIDDDQSVILDNGTTNDALAQTLVGRRMTVLCLTLHAAVALGTSRDIRVIVPGGLITPDSLSATAAASIQAARDMRADVSVLGACAASPAHGLTTATWDDAQIKRAIAAAGARRIMLATGQKLARTSSFRFGGFDDLDDLVVTEDAPEAVVDQFREAGVQVHVAPETARRSDDD